jgi:hypothetical protein
MLDYSVPQELKNAPTQTHTRADHPSSPRSGSASFPRSFGQRVSKKLGIAVQTYYRWRREYGGLKVDQAKRLRDLEKENARLKRVVGELALDKAILKEAASGNF